MNPVPVRASAACLSALCDFLLAQAVRPDLKAEGHHVALLEEALRESGPGPIQDALLALAVRLRAQAEDEAMAERLSTLTAAARKTVLEPAAIVEALNRHRPESPDASANEVQWRFTVAAYLHLAEPTVLDRHSLGVLMERLPRADPADLAALWRLAHDETPAAASMVRRALHDTLGRGRPGWVRAGAVSPFVAKVQEALRRRLPVNPWWKSRGAQLATLAACGLLLLVLLGAALTSRASTEPSTKAPPADAGKPPVKPEPTASQPLAPPEADTPLTLSVPGMRILTVVSFQLQGSSDLEIKARLHEWLAAPRGSKGDDKGSGGPAIFDYTDTPASRIVPASCLDTPRAGQILRRMVDAKVVPDVNCAVVVRLLMHQAQTVMVSIQCFDLRDSGQSQLPHTPEKATGATPGQRPSAPAAGKMGGEPAKHAPAEAPKVPTERGRAVQESSTRLVPLQWHGRLSLKLTTSPIIIVAPVKDQEVLCTALSFPESGTPALLAAEAVVAMPQPSARMYLLAACAYLHDSNGLHYYGSDVQAKQRRAKEILRGGYAEHSDNEPILRLLYALETDCQRKILQGQRPEVLNAKLNAFRDLVDDVARERMVQQWIQAFLSEARNRER